MIVHDPGFLWYALIISIYMDLCTKIWNVLSKRTKKQNMDLRFAYDKRKVPKNIHLVSNDHLARLFSYHKSISSYD